MNLDIFKSVFASTFKGRYFWVSFSIVTLLMTIAIGIVSYSAADPKIGEGKWQSMWLSGGWNQLYIFVVGFAQVQLIKNKFGNLIWKNSNTFQKFFSFFVIQNLLYALLFTFTLGLLQQIFALIFFQAPISYNIEVIKAFIGLFYSGMIISALVWLLPSVWTIIVFYLLLQFQEVGNMLLYMKYPDYVWVASLLPSTYISKLGSIQIWEWYEYVLFFGFLFGSMMTLAYRYRKIWKFN